MTPTRIRQDQAFAHRRRRENAALRRLLGLLTAIPIPGFAYALTAANVGAIGAIGLRNTTGLPRFVKPLIVWFLISGGMVFTSALVQRTAIPNLVIISTISLVMLLAGFANVTEDVSTSVHLLTWASIGMVGFFLIIGAENTRDTFEHLWKYGIAVPIGLILTSVVTRSSARMLWPVVALLAIGGLSVALGFRSHGLVCIAAVLILFAKGSSKSRGGSVFKIVVASVLFAAAAVAVPAAIGSGLFGDTVRTRTEEQLTSGASPLLSGRVEPPLSMAAILAKPVFGWGSANAIDDETIAHGQQIAAKLGLDNPASYMNLWVRRDGRVSLHSVFFEAWVQGGIIAVIAPTLMVALFVIAVFRTTGKWSPVVILVSVQGVWDIVFSTWGAQRPTLLAVSVLVAAWAVTVSASPARTAFERDLTEATQRRTRSRVRAV